MRVIAGKYKGRRLETPRGQSIRPTTDKVKEAMFSILNEKLYGARVIDLFSGTGGLGIEALSRGAAYCWFCDKSREALSLIKYNLDHCGIGAEEGAEILAGTFQKNLAAIGDSGEKADIIILDPPYSEGLYDECFRIISELQLLAEDGIIVAEHSTDDRLAEEYTGFSKIKERKYGTMTLSIYGGFAD